MQSNYALDQVCGIDARKRGKIVFRDKDSFLYASANSIFQYEISSNTSRCMFSIQHSNKKLALSNTDKKKSFVFIGEQGKDPFIYKIRLSDFLVLDKLNGGATQGYACISVSKDDNFLCTVSTAPDYLLSIWDLKTKTIILQHKENNENVTNVAFSPYNDRCLMTSGEGHFRFWNILSTFTGMKLQVEIGKFGKMDPSDVHDFVELPDGRVLSGSESGHLILWDKKFALCRYAMKESGNFSEGAPGNETLPLHEGGLFFAEYDSNRKEILTAGADGYLKWWKIDCFTSFDANIEYLSDETIEPIKTVYISKYCMINDIIGPADGFLTYFVQDMNGSLWKLDMKENETKRIWDFHSGRINSIDFSSSNEIVVTAGSDGTLRCWGSKDVIPWAMYRHNVSCCIARFIPSASNESNDNIIAGYEDGVIRLFELHDQKLALNQAFKPHQSMVNFISCSKDGKFIATVGIDKTVFILSYSKDSIQSTRCIPIGFFYTVDVVFQIDWRYDGCSVFYITVIGDAIEVMLTPDKLMPTNKDSFLLDVNARNLNKIDNVYAFNPNLISANEKDDEGYVSGSTVFASDDQGQSMTQYVNLFSTQDKKNNTKSNQTESKRLFSQAHFQLKDCNLSTHNCISLFFHYFSELLSILHTGSQQLYNRE